MYPLPAFLTNIELTRLNPLPASPIDAIPIARSLAIPAAGAATVTVGTVPNPTPLSVITNLTTPFDAVLIEQVAAAPVPPPPEIVIIGGDVYCAPALVINIFSIDVTFALVVVNATAVALSPDKPLGEVLIATVGVPVNPEPSLFKNISRIYPEAKIGVACAVIPVSYTHLTLPTRLMV